MWIYKRTHKDGREYGRVKTKWNEVMGLLEKRNRKWQTSACKGYIDIKYAAFNSTTAQHIEALCNAFYCIKRGRVFCAVESFWSLSSARITYIITIYEECNRSNRSLALTSLKTDSLTLALQTKVHRTWYNLHLTSRLETGKISIMFLTNNKRVISRKYIDHSVTVYFTPREVLTLL